MRLRWNGRHFADNIFKCIFFDENFLMKMFNIDKDFTEACSQDSTL